MNSLRKKQSPLVVCNAKSKPLKSDLSRINENRNS